MHTINLSNYSVRTDLIVEENDQTNFKNTTKIIENIKVETTTSITNDNKYTTISFDDVTDKDKFQKAEQVLIAELKPYIESSQLKATDPVLIIGLGNEKSTPDSLGPKTIKQILVTKYLFDLGEVEEGYQSTAAFSPSVTSITGIETSTAIKALVKSISAKLLIVIDALASSSLSRLNKTVQITNTGIHPGSGVGNNRQELNNDTLGIPVIAIGVPTVVDASTIVSDTFNYLKQQFSYKINNIDNNKLKLIPESVQDYRTETKELTLSAKKEILGEVGALSDEDFKQLINEVLSPINSNLMVTPTEIDFLIERLGLLIGESINKSLHQHFNPTK